MDESITDLQEKIRQQFESAPYPAAPLDKSPKEDWISLFIHSLATPYYLEKQAVIHSKDLLILDAGCGSGYKSLILAEANPGAKIIGIDLSEESINLARSRLQFHGFENAEFYVLGIEQLPELGLTFDYINCDEVLYLLPDIVTGLKCMKAVLKPTGIIRSNLHSAIQRFHFFRIQEVFKIMGLFDSNPEDLEVSVALDTVKALKDGVEIKDKVWRTNYGDDDLKQFVLMNYLFQGDKGFTTVDLFDFLRAADLEIVNMVNWHHWELIELFESPDDLPFLWAMSLPELPLEQRLRLFELMHPIHRLLDFWCTNPGQKVTRQVPSEWEPERWRRSRIHLHPVLQSTQIKTDLINCINQKQAFEISRYLPVSTNKVVNIDSSSAACLLPLWDGSQSIETLVDRWLAISPVDPVTLEPVNRDSAFTQVTGFLSQLETRLYVLLE